MASDSSSSGRFTSQGTTAQDLLASQTVGLVNLSDFRKRRADALEQKEREAGSFGHSTAPSSGSATPKLNDEGSTTPTERPKKKRKPIAKGKLSFGVEDEEDDNESTHSTGASTTQTSKPITANGSARASPIPEKSRLGPNSTIAAAAPRALTKAALRNESQTRDALRLEFLAMQEAVRATEIVIPFVFYDGTNIPGGACKIKKGDHIWLFLDRARKLGAASGVNAAGERGGGSRRDWARVGVDDLIFVRGEVIIPHHYEIYYFLVNKVLGPNSDRLFNYSDTPTKPSVAASATASATTTTTTTNAASPDDNSESKAYNPISQPFKTPTTTNNTNITKPKKSGQVTSQDNHLEGINDDANLTKVVDRRWYERNKHIFPASVWETYDPGKTYEGKIRTDARGNAFFFS